MKKTPESTDYETDDEALREAAFRDGPRKAGKWKLRPCVPGTISIIRSNMLEKRDEFWFVAAFAFVHIAPIDDILAVDNDPIAFNKAVRRWQLDNLTTIDEQNELSALVSAAWERVNAAETKAKHASTGSTESGK
jgi:zona occludens toxin (predicted ATPase)